MPTKADEVLAQLRQHVRQRRNALAVEITANLMEPPDEGGTPVKTGWARSNWIPSISVPVSSPSGSPESVNGGQQQQGIAAVAGYQGDDPVFVTNNVPYIQQLNDGSSKKAPAGFVEAAVDKAVQAVANGQATAIVSRG